MQKDMNKQNMCTPGAVEQGGQHKGQVHTRTHVLIDANIRTHNHVHKYTLTKTIVTHSLQVGLVLLSLRMG